MDKEKKDTQIQIRLCRSDSDIIKENAVSAGYSSVSEYLRKTGLQQPHEDATLRAIHTILSRSLGLLNQVTKKINSGDFDPSNLAEFKRLFVAMFEQSTAIDTKYKRRRSSPSKLARNNDPAVKAKLQSTPKASRLSPTEKALFNNNALLKLKAMMDDGRADYEHTDYSKRLANALIESLSICINDEQYTRRLIPHFETLRDGFKSAVHIKKIEAPDPDYLELWEDVDDKYVELLTIIQDIEKGLDNPV